MYCIVLGTFVNTLNVLALGNKDIKPIIPTSQISDVIQTHYKSDLSCPWNCNTKVKEIIYVHDLEGNVNGAIINLSTNNSSSGYMMYSILDGKTVLNEFSYDGVYCIEGEEVTKNSKLGCCKLIYNGMLDYLKQTGTEVYTIDGNTHISNDRKIKIKEKYDLLTCKLKERNKLVRSTTLINNQIVYDKGNLCNLWKSGYKPVYMTMYGNKGCGVVCGVNMLKYWNECRNVPSLYNSDDATKLTQTYGRLYECMKASTNGHTVSINEYNGIMEYCTKYKCTSPKGDCFKNGFDWEWYVTQIRNDNFVCVSSKIENYENDARKSYHAFSGVGWEDTSTGRYIRVGDQWNDSYSHFFNVSVYSDDIRSMWYVRWL